MKTPKMVIGCKMGDVRRRCSNLDTKQNKSDDSVPRHDSHTSWAFSRLSDGVDFPFRVIKCCISWRPRIDASIRDLVIASMLSLFRARCVAGMCTAKEKSFFVTSDSLSCWHRIECGFARGVHF